MGFKRIRGARTVVLCCALLSAGASTGTTAAEDAVRTLRVGAFDNRPIVLHDTDGGYAGIAIDVLEAVARAERWRLEYRYGAWDDILEDLETGRLDLLVGIAHSEQRARRVRFGQESLLGNWGVVYAGQRAAILSPLDLRERRVAVMRRSIHTDEFQRLMRQFQDPERGPVAPDQFIPYAEESGLIVPIGDWVLERACAQLSEWNRRHGRTLRVAVNVSGRQFQGGKLVESVARALRHAGLEPDLLELEITEGVLMVMTTEVRRALDGLRELGVHLAIDDFGTGYSSLSYLKHLPIGILKIDRSFVRGIPESRDDVQIATTIVTMAHGPGRAVVAEGIETAAQRDLLRANGCRCGQGYLFARPLAVADLDAWLAGEPARVARG